ALPVATGKTEDDFPAACYGPDGTLWVAWVGYHVKDESRRIEQKPLLQQPKDFKAYYTPGFSDQVLVKFLKDGRWSERIAVTDPIEDVVGCAVAANGDGDVWVTYSVKRVGGYHLYGRRVEIASGAEGGAWKARVLPEERLSKEHIETNCLRPAMATGQDGHTYLAFLAHGKESACGIMERKNGNWGAHLFGATNAVVFGGDHAWAPTITTGPDVEVAIACDDYEKGSHDLALDATIRDQGGLLNSATAPVKSDRFEARPSVAYDPAGRLWIAYEEGPELWGKDFGALAPGHGEPLYSSRSVRVVCLENGKLMRPVAELPTSNARAPGGVQEGASW